MFEPEEMHETGDQVVAIVRIRARGKASGASIDTRTGMVSAFRDGKLVRWRHYSDPEEALEAAGLRG
jgi:ketosteroid isomerase-like protein